MRFICFPNPVRVSGPEVGTLQGFTWHLNVPIGGVRGDLGLVGVAPSPYLWYSTGGMYEEAKANQNLESDLRKANCSCLHRACFCF